MAHHKKLGDEKLFLKSVRTKSPFSGLKLSSVITADKIGPNRILSSRQLKPKSKLLSELYSSVPENMFGFYCAFSNDIDDEATGFYCPTPNAIYMPAGIIVRIEHETAHFLEMGSLKRLTYTDMGMSLGAGRGTAYLASFTRELRVRQIERVLMCEEGANEPVKNFEDVMRNPVWGAPVGKKFPTKKHAEEWAIDLANRTRRMWTEEKIRHEWTRRCEFMQDWMLTSKNHTHPSVQTHA